MANFQQKFGLRLRELRKRKGLTQEHLAELLNIGVRSVGKIETGNSFPSTETMEKIINVFEISPVELFDFEHFQSKDSLKDLIFDMVNSNPDKVQDIYKVVKALTV